MSSVPMIDFRRALIRFSATLVGLITVVGLSSLFSIWSMNRAYERGDREIERIRDLVALGNRAQIDFKVQVQEWKNVLLRGSEPQARARYMNAFEKREAAVQGDLRNLAALTEEAGLVEYRGIVLDLVAEHRRLGQSYRDALALAPELSADAARRVDSVVVGIDRDLQNRIDGLSQEMHALNLVRRDALLEQLDRRYATLRRVLLLVIVFSLAVTGASLFTALRATRD